MSTMPIPPGTPGAPSGLGGIFGRLGGIFTPPGGIEGMDPELLKRQQQQALLTMGLGMLAAKERGAGLGQGLLQGFGLGNQQFQDIANRTFQNTLWNRQQARQDRREDRADRAFARQEDWRREDRAYQADQDRIRQEQWQKQFRLSEDQASRAALMQGTQREAILQELQRERQYEARRQELLAKPNRTESEDIELDQLTRGAVSARMRSQSLLGLGGFGLGGFGGLPAPGSASPLPPDPWQTGGGSRGGTGNW
jgi:hypothetical protein